MNYPANIEHAKNDRLTIRTASLGRLKDILYSRDSSNRIFQTRSSGPTLDPRRIALLAVASKWDDDRSEVLAVLESIATGAIPDLKDEAASIVEQLKKKLEADKTRNGTTIEQDTSRCRKTGKRQFSGARNAISVVLLNRETRNTTQRIKIHGF